MGVVKINYPLSCASTGGRVLKERFIGDHSTFLSIGQKFHIKFHWIKFLAKVRGPLPVRRLLGDPGDRAHRWLRLFGPVLGIYFCGSEQYACDLRTLFVWPLLPMCYHRDQEWIYTFSFRMNINFADWVGQKKTSQAILLEMFPLQFISPVRKWWFMERLTLSPAVGRFWAGFASEVCWEFTLFGRFGLARVWRCVFLFPNEPQFWISRHDFHFLAL